jgi:hypothetical protein
MEPDFIARNLQFALEAFKAFGPVAIFAALTYWLTTWGEK